MKDVRVVMNIGSPDITVYKGNKAMTKHTLLGVASPLNGFVDMVAFNNKLVQVESWRDQAKEQSDTFQVKYNLAEMLTGTGPGQTQETVNTIYYGVAQVRDILKVKNRGTEEELQFWGFNVVITQQGSRRRVRIDIPYGSTKKMHKLGKDIVARDTALGVASPLVGNFDVATFGGIVSNVTTLLADWELAKDATQVLNNQALNLIGYGAGQTKDTPGTIYYDRISIRDRLLQVYQGTEEQLTPFGFDVIISEHTAAHPGGGAGAAANPGVVQESDVLPNNSWSVNVSGLNATPQSIINAVATGSAFRLYAAPTAAGLPIPGPSIIINTSSPLEELLQQFADQLGLNQSNPYLIAQNLGSTTGHLKIVFENLGE
jgi:hypothetical protein